MQWNSSNWDVSFILVFHFFLNLIIILIYNYNPKYNVSTDEFCEEYPHQLIPTPGYWIECSRQKITNPNQNIWDESESGKTVNLE